MNQSGLFEVNVIWETDSTALFDGADLKRIARGDDGRDYACKRIADGPTIPISEWIGYQLWRACGMLTPDFSVLRYSDGSPPAFGSRIELQANQVKNNPDHYSIIGFFRPHLRTVSLAFPLDAFYINPDRHGRNFLERPTLTDPELLCFDFSRAGAANSNPWGDEQSMATCNTAAWWNFFKNLMKASVDLTALQRASQLSDAWFEEQLHAAPSEWTSPIRIDEAVHFWHASRHARAEFAKQWASAI